MNCNRFWHPVQQIDSTDESRRDQLARFFGGGGAKGDGGSFPEVKIPFCHCLGNIPSFHQASLAY
jgi:hypothetical protein